MKSVKPFIALILLSAVQSAYAATQPFTWPKSYMYTYRETGTVTDIHVTPFYNMAAKDGLNYRNQRFKGNEVKDITIFRLEDHKQITIHPDGRVEEKMLPDDYPTGSDVFTDKGTWEDLGTDILRGQKANKYRVTSPSNHRHMTIWLSEDNKIPLRMEEDAQEVYKKDGLVIVDFFNFYAGPINPALFQAVEKK